MRTSESASGTVMLMMMMMMITSSPPSVSRTASHTAHRGAHTAPARARAAAVLLRDPSYPVAAQVVWAAWESRWPSWSGWSRALCSRSVRLEAPFRAHLMDLHSEDLWLSTAILTLPQVSPFSANRTSRTTPCPSTNSALPPDDPYGYSALASTSPPTYSPPSSSSIPSPSSFSRRSAPSRSSSTPSSPG